MYRWLLCLRYLRTRYIALASVISVTLGVATLIVVNAVMSGFAAEMHDKMRSLASDIVIESHAPGGLPAPEECMRKINQLVGDKLAGSTFSVHVPAMLTIENGGRPIRHQIKLIGLDGATYDNVSDFGKYLLHPENQKQVQFLLRDGGYAPDRASFPQSGVAYRNSRLAYEKEYAANQALQRAPDSQEPGPSLLDGEGEEAVSETDGPQYQIALPDSDLISDETEEMSEFPGIILGIATAWTSMRDSQGAVQDYYFCRPGDDVRVTFPGASKQLKVLNQQFTVVDLFQSGMSEYDSNFAFCSIETLQDLRGMIDPQSNTRSVTTIQLKLVEQASLNQVRDTLREAFPPTHYPYTIRTWRDMQGPLLAAVRMETTILNILLFLIIAVAGFGILATFFMIVVEKTRDIGTLKSLGASSSGIMRIFLTYGLLLGLVGSGVGLLGGLVFVGHINQIAGLIETVTGQEVFDPTIYYFNEIPTVIEPLTLAWVMAGAVGIATLASVLPALRAARMHPVVALRYE